MPEYASIANRVSPNGGGAAATQSAERYRRLVAICAAVLLVLMGVLMFASSWNDSPTNDEEAHIGAGYSYLRKQDYRMNPEHPPLMKDLAALPLLFLKLAPPWNDTTWLQREQYPFGHKLLYDSGEDADSVTRLARVPMILFALAFGGLLFWWTRRRFGSGTALLTLFLYCFSPTVLAHSRLVTTDLGATAGFFTAIIGFLYLLEKPTAWNVLLAGVIAGFAFLAKFSTALLAPLLLLFACAWWFASYRATDDATQMGRRLLRHLMLTAGVLATAMVVVYGVYLSHTWNYPLQMQRDWANSQMGTPKPGFSARNVVLWADSHRVLQPWGQYFSGLLAIMRYSRFPNQPFFLGRLREPVWHTYFPLVYLIKEPLAMHLLTLAALIIAIASAARSRGRSGSPIAAFRNWLRSHFVQFAFLSAIAVYWAFALRANLMIGVRHILPTFPLTYVLVASQISAFSRSLFKRAARISCAAVIGALVLWQAVGVLRVHPSYLAYFNEIAGGPDGGYRFVVDSNLDWGQDLKRLADYTQKQHVEHLYLDYFGSADPDYYFHGKWESITGCDAPPKGWVAVSASFYPGASWRPTCDYRRWLPMDKLVTKIGYSIYVFHLE